MKITSPFSDSISPQFLLRQAFADDEASTRLLQILLFLLLSTASLMFNVVICNCICVYHVEVSWSYMPGGDHSSPCRVRKPVGPLGPPSPSGVLPTPASCVGQIFGVPSVRLSNNSSSPTFTSVRNLGVSFILIPLSNHIRIPLALSSPWNASSILKLPLPLLPPLLTQILITTISFFTIYFKTL